MCTRFPLLHRHLVGEKPGQGLPYGPGQKKLALEGTEEERAKLHHYLKDLGDALVAPRITAQYVCPAWQWNVCFSKKH